MNVLVDNSGYHLRNVGDLAMLKAAVARFRGWNPQGRVEVFTSAPDLLAATVDAAAVPVDPRERAAWADASVLPGGPGDRPYRLRRRLRSVERAFRRRRPGLFWTAVRGRERLLVGPGGSATRLVDRVRRADLVAVTGGGVLHGRVRRARRRRADDVGDRPRCSP